MILWIQSLQAELSDSQHSRKMCHSSNLPQDLSSVEPQNDVKAEGKSSNDNAGHVPSANRLSGPVRLTSICAIEYRVQTDYVLARRGRTAP